MAERAAVTTRVVVGSVTVEAGLKMAIILLGGFLKFLTSWR